jgi:DNA-binding MarR family transcriptional regulator
MAASVVPIPFWLSAGFRCHTYQERDRQAFVGASSRWNVYNGFVMASKTRKRGGHEESVFLELLRTTDILSRRLSQTLKKEELSGTQYNVLRILRGAPAGLSCGEIGNRMITRDPDITRLLDRLKKRGLISRSRETKDRRTVMVRIRPAGLDLVGRLDEPVQAVHREQLGHLGERRLKELSELLTACRDGLA